MCYIIFYYTTNAIFVKYNLTSSYTQILLVSKKNENSHIYKFICVLLINNIGYRLLSNLGPSVLG